jgi:hypothetical protein
MSVRKAINEAKKAKMRALGFETARQLADKLWESGRETADAMNAFLAQFPRGPMNLTPDFVKAMPEYQALRAAGENSHRALRDFNAVYTVVFKKEIAAYRAAERQKKLDMENKNG